MADSTDLPDQSKLRLFARILVYLTISLGILVLLGWKFDLDFLKRPLPYLAAMNPATAILFILTGVSLLCLYPNPNSRVGRIDGYILSGTVASIAIIRLLDSAFDFSIHIDLLPFAEKQEQEVASGFSNRMALHTAICFLLINAALPMLHHKTPRGRMPAQYLALIVGFISLLSILGCLYQVPTFYMKMAYIPMAIHTAFGFLFLALSILFSNPHQGIMKELTSSLSGSQMARFLIPAAIVVPLCLGYIKLVGHWHSVYSSEFGVALLILSIIIIFVILIWYIAVTLNKKDFLRLDTETQLKISLIQLRESEEKFQKAFSASLAGMTITRLSDSKYVEVNEGFIQLTGYSKEELIGRSSTDLGLVIDVKNREKILQKIKSEGNAKQFEMTIRNKTGAILEVLSSVETIEFNGNKHAINIIFDITDRKQAEMQLEAVNKELEAFSYSISHDLRAPLRAINGFSKMLEEDYNQLFDEEGKELLETIQYNTKKMGDLIDSLLAFSRLGRKTIAKTDLDMNGLVSSVIQDIERSLDHKAEIKIGVLYPTKGDSTLIKQVFTNLVSNAIKYSSKKEISLIEINSELRDDEVLYIVKDNGEGFDMAYSNKLFGVFQRLHRESEFEGTGVGLAIVQRIVNKHEGKVWAEGELGKGATFSFTLPIN
jgi:PAS domain S-box-containing protein